MRALDLLLEFGEAAIFHGRLFRWIDQETSEPRNAHQQAQDNAHQSLSQGEAETAIKAAEAVGVEITGVDLTTVENEACVIDVNASPRLRRLLNTTGINAAQKTAEYALTKAEQPCRQLSSEDPQRSLHSLV